MVFDKDTVYTASPSGGIQAIDLEKGNVLWSSQAAAWPIAIGSGKLVALTDPRAGGMQVDFFDPSNGNSLAGFGSIGLPEWAHPSIGYGSKSKDFWIWPASIWSGGMVIYWRAQRWSPVTLYNYRQKQTLQQVQGRILIDFARNSVEAHEIPITGEPPQENERPDRSLPMVKGQKALASVVAGDRTLALVQSGSDISLQCFKDRLLIWTQNLAKK